MLLWKRPGSTILFFPCPHRISIMVMMPNRLQLPGKSTKNWEQQSIMIPDTSALQPAFRSPMPKGLYPPEPGTPGSERCYHRQGRRAFRISCRYDQGPSQYDRTQYYGTVPRYPLCYPTHRIVPALYVPVHERRLKNTRQEQAYG